MKKMIMVLLMSLSFLEQAYSHINMDLIGKWQYINYRYQGNTYPILDSDLIMTYEFGLDSTSRLHWTWIKETNKFCERAGQYSFSSNELIEFVTWINTNNHYSCSSDPDMQPNKLNKINYKIVDDKLELELDLSGEPIFYIWKRISN